MTGVPSVAEVRAWTSLSPTSVTDAQLQIVIDGELAGQAASCRVPADPDAYPPYLVEALLRRVARFCAARQIPVGLYGDPASEYGPTAVPSFDAEIERVEGPFRIVVFG